MPKKDYFVHTSSIIDRGAKIGKGTQIWHFTHIMPHATIGKNCKIGQNAFIGSHVVIGNNVKIQNNVSVYEGVTLENDVFCGPSMVFTNVINPRCLFPRNDARHFLKTHVGQGASIGANVTIVCGVTIGKHSFIGAGSVVTKDVPAYALVYGNPACQHGWMCVCGERLSTRKSHSICPVCGEDYALSPVRKQIRKKRKTNERR